ncbi:hypothetical protein L9F63_016471, partial [Diploptera punctata]
TACGRYAKLNHCVIQRAIKRDVEDKFMSDCVIDNENNPQSSDEFRRQIEVIIYLENFQRKNGNECKITHFVNYTNRSESRNRLIGAWSLNIY